MLTGVDFWGGVIVGLAMILCFAAEQWRPLRTRARPRHERLGTNVPMVVMAALTLHPAMVPAALAVAAAAERAGVGLLRLLALPFRHQRPAWDRR